MKNTKRKGFTIVELVIVISVIAILAAVLIPTFASLINKANRSADIQAVHQMNTQLAIDEVDSNKTIVDVYAALEEGGMTAKDYHPLASDTYFFWIEALNRIVYTDKSYKVTFPEEYENQAVSAVAGDKAYLSLSGEIEQKPVEIGTDGTATVSSAEELYWLSENAPANLKKIIFNTESINLMGANVSLSVGDGTNEKSLTITGKEGGTTLKGLVQLTNKLDGADSDTKKKYAAGFVALVEKNADLDISNIIIDGATVGDYEIGTVGILIGRIGQEAGKVEVKNCTVKNSTVYGMNKVAPLIGSIGRAIVNVEGCTVDSCTVNCTEGEAGKVIGCVYNSGAYVTIDKDFSDEWVKNTTINLVKDDKNRKIVDYTEGDCQKLVQKYSVEDSNLETEYRMFADDAYMNILKNAPSGEKLADLDNKDTVDNRSGIYVEIASTSKYTLTGVDVYVDPNATPKVLKSISEQYAGTGLVIIK